LAGSCIQNFFQRYHPIATTWEVYVNLDPNGYDLIACGDPETPEKVLNVDLWQQFRKNI
jgi:hypothetical protein